MLPSTPNLDCLGDATEMWAFAESVREAPTKAAREMFPARPRGYVTATRHLMRYAYNKAIAMRCRARGDISAALDYESICDRIHDRLPEFARW